MFSDPHKLLSQSVTADLYRAAIGPRGQDAYLRHFLRFDVEGRTRLSWHWPACLITLNWLIYRKMWRLAISYVATVLGVMLIVFGVGKLLFAYSATVGALLLLALVLVACVVPGLYGNTWYYAWCNERISAALRETDDNKSACVVLASEASSNRRWGVMALVNGVLIMLLASALAVLLRSGPEVDAGEEILLPAKPAASVPASGLKAAMPTPTPTPTPTPAPAPAPAPAASAALPAPAVPVAVPPAEPVPVAKPQPKAADKEKVANEKPAPAKSVSAKPVPSKEKEKAPVARGWQVQVGAFAQEANAQKARARVEMAGLPLSAEPPAKDGALIRVRVGPFASKAEAEQAAEQLKALELPAVLVRP